MVEALISAGLAVITGIIALNNRVNGRIDHANQRISQVDRRIDALELGVVRDFVPKRELAEAIAKIEGHMIRIEDKLDAMIRPLKVREDD